MLAAAAYEVMVQGQRATRMPIQGPSVAALPAWLGLWLGHL